MKLSLFNSLCYSAGWFWCVLLGIKGQSLLALLGTLFLLVVQLSYAKKNNTALYIQDLLLSFFSIPLGICLEVVFIQTGLLHYVDTNNALPPLWIVCLYPLFALVLNHSLKIVKKSSWISFAVGFAAAPFSYLGGASFGGVTFLYPMLPSLLLIGTGWGLYLCLLAKIAKTIEKAAAETLADRDSNNPLKLLYDGACPICHKEICLLQKRKDQNTISFIDISSKEFSPAENRHIDYQTAMSEIHAIDAKGNLLVGVPAFAAVYARCRLLVLSTLMRIPLLEGILKSCYKLFAKNRLWITGRDATQLKK